MRHAFNFVSSRKDIVGNVLLSESNHTVLPLVMLVAHYTLHGFFGASKTINILSTVQCAIK